MGLLSRALEAFSVCLFAVAFLLPLTWFFIRFGLGGLTGVLSTAFYLRVLGFTVYQALLSALLAVACGLPAAYILAKYDFSLKRVVKSVFMVPFIIPGILVVLGFVIFFGNRGYVATILGREIHILYSFKAILVAHVFYNFPVIAILCSDALEKLDYSIEDDAKLSGVGPGRIFFGITLPRIVPSMLSATVLVFLFCFTSFSIIMVLGGGPKHTTTEVEIYRMAAVGLDFSTAGALSLMSMAVCILMLFVSRALSSKKYYMEDSNIKTRPLGKAKVSFRIFACAYLVVSAVFILGPVLSLIARSFQGSVTRGGSYILTLRAYRALDAGVFRDTLLIGFLSAFLSCTLAYGFCGSRLGSLAMLPMVVSSVVVGLVYLVISRFIREVPALLMISLMHGIVNLPFAYRTLRSASLNIPSEYREWAAISGISHVRYSFQVELPVLRRSIVSSFLFCFALSCGELNSTLILGSSRVSTASVSIMRMISAYNYSGACAAGTVLIVLNFVVFYSVRLMESNQHGALHF